MLLKNSISTFFNNVDLLYKILLIIFVLFIICSALIVLIFDPIFDTIINGFDWEGEIKVAINKWLDGEPHAIRELIDDVKISIKSNINDFYVGIGLLGGVMFMFKFFASFVIIPIADVLYNKMNKNYKVKLRSAMIANFAKSLLFGFIYTLITLIIDAGIIALSVAATIWLFGAVGSIAMTLGAIITIALISLRIAILSQWVPLIVAKKYTVLKAFIQSFKYSAKNIGTTLPAYAFVMIFMFAIIMSTAIPTFFIVPIIAFPTYAILSTAINLLTYIKENNEKFYLDEKTVI